MKLDICRSNLTLIAYCFFFVVYSSAFAQSKKDSIKTYTLNPVVITATQTEALRSQVPNTVSIISREDLKQSGETSVLPVINKLVPGVYITERGVLGYSVSNGAAGAISIRGTGGSPNTEVLMLTDGRPQMMGLMGHPLPDMYVSSNVERIEVIRGPASILYGTNAMGGVINIISTQPPAGISANAAASYGTFNTRKLEGGLGYGADDAGFNISGSNYYTDGHRAYSDFRITNGAIKGFKTINEHFSIKADASISKFRTYDPGTESKPLIDNWVDILRGSAGFAFENTFTNARGAVKGFYNFGQHKIYDGFRSVDNNIGFLAYESLTMLPGNIITVGIDLKRYGGDASNSIKILSYGGTHHVSESAAYILVQQKFLTILNASAGVRANHNSLYGNEVVPQFGLTAELCKTTTLRASAGKGFRSPTIRELYLFPTPNASLQPERMWNYEFGVLQTIHEIVNLDITAYQSEGTNIIRTSGTYPNMKLSNSGSFVHRGVEVSADAKVCEQSNLTVSYGYLDPENQTMANPRHKFYMGASYKLQKFNFNAGIQQIVGLYGNDYSKNRLSDYTLVNARVAMEYIEGLTFYISGENLLDKKYQIMLGYPMPGATVFGGVNWSLR